MSEFHSTTAPRVVPGPAAETYAAGADVYAAARAYVAAGVSVVPVRTDGTKAPRFPGWRAYARRLPTADELARWFDVPHPDGIGVPCGPASGHLAVLDFEYRPGADPYGDWRSALPDEEAEWLASCPVVRTPSGGVHVWCRLPESVPGVVLARWADQRTKVEVRGEGHQVLAPGCPLSCHQSGRPYEFLQHGWLAAPSEPVPFETYFAWAERAASLSEYDPPPAPAAPAPADRPARRPGDTAPGDDFNRRGTWEEAGLFAAGWAWERHVGGDRGFVRRPGKARGTGGTVGIVSSQRNGWPLFKCFTSNGGAFEPGGVYDRFGVLARLAHGGDFAAAARALAGRGYGTPRRAEPVPSANGKHPGGEPAPAEPGPEAEGRPKDKPPARPFAWMSELRYREATDKWLWHGYLSRGGITILNALWKAGKSTLLAHLLNAFGVGGPFCGLAVKAAGVLYVSEEDQETWAERRDELGIGDHVGMWCRPFRGRPTMAQWLAFLKTLIEQVRAYGFEVVVIDTLSKLWPVRDENDATQVEDALMPLWSLTDAGVAVLLVHHMRKSEGDQFTAGRGSGGTQAFAETLIDLRRYDPANARDARRVLKGGGRYRETPEELVVQLTADGYVALGEVEGQEQTTLAALLDRVLPLGPPGKTYPELAASLKDARGGDRGFREESVRAELARRLREKVLIVNGTGAKGKPQRYYRTTQG